MEKIEKLLQQRYHLTDTTALHELVKNLTICQVGKEERIISEGETPTEIYFLISGILRGFYLSEQGKEITDCFAFEPGEVVASDIPPESPATITMETVKPCQFAALSICKMYDMMEIYPEISSIYIQCLTVSLNRHRNHKIALSRYCAENRYRWMKRTYPGLMDQVKKKHIASFLNITPQTMSNLRKRERNERIGTAANENPSDADHEI